MKKIKGNKKIIIIVLTTIVLILTTALIFLIGVINISNLKEYKDIKNHYQEVLGEDLNLGLIHRKEEIEQAKVDFDTKLEEYQKEIDSKVKSLSFDTKDFVETNKIEVPYALSKQVKLLNTAGLVDNIKAINTYDNYKPEKNNDAIKKEVKDIDTKSAEAYDLVVKQISTTITVTKEDVTKFLKDLDFKKALTDAQMKSLKTISTIDFSDEFIKQISDAKDVIKKIVDNIKKEVKTIQDKEKKDADAAKAKANAGGSGAVSSGTYTGGGSTSNASSMNDWCKKTYGSQGWTQWYPSENLCGYPESYKPEYKNPNAIENMSPAQARDAIERDLFTVIRDYGSYMGVEANPVIGQWANDPSMGNSWIGYENEKIDARQWDSYQIAQGLFDAYLENELRYDPNAVPHGNFYVNVYVTDDYIVSASIGADFS